MANVFAPHITSPVGGELFNRGTVTIEWNTNLPPSVDEYGADVELPEITFEIEYSDTYNESNPVWSTLKRRIPSSSSSYTWVVGKMVKSSTVRIRMRSRLTSTGEVSDWSMITGNFAINVFKLIPPAIVSPLSNHSYNHFILIILDETLTKETFSQKVRYTFEYSSLKNEISWTVIAKDVPFGKNVVRWNIDGLTPSDDYTLRVTIKNSSTSCKETEPEQPDQIAYRFIYNISIQQPGMFIIDTKPPQAIVDVDNVFGVTNELNQIINIYAEDQTTDVLQIQMRECNASQQLALGNIDNPLIGTTDCQDIEELVAGNDIDFDRVLGKPQGYASKILWTFGDKSGLLKLEALLTDYGGNTSLQEKTKNFLSVFKSDTEIYDVVIAQEPRENVTISQDDEGNVIVNTESATFEVAYIATLGKFWVLEPFPRLIYESSLNREIRRIFVFGGIVYIFTYYSTNDEGIVFRDDKTDVTYLYTFPNSLSIPNAVTEYKNKMYIGLENGEVYSYDGASFVLLHTFDTPVSSLVGDSEYLYIGFTNSQAINLYNGTDIFNLEISS